MTTRFLVAVGIVCSSGIMSQAAPGWILQPALATNHAVRIPSSGTPSEGKASGSLVAQAAKMLQARIDPTVVEKFIESWTVPYLTSAADLRRLQDAGAAPSILNTYARRGAELRLRAHQTVHVEAGTNSPPVFFYPVASPPSGLETRWPICSTPPVPLYLFSESLPFVAEAYAFDSEWESFYWRPPFRRR